MAIALLAGTPAWSADKKLPVSFSGPCYFRLPGYHGFVLQNGADSVPEDTLVTVRPDVQNPNASDSHLLVGSYTITLLPGAALKAMHRGIVPLSGRFLFYGEGNEALIFMTRSFELHYKGGRLLLEITPDDGTFIALRNKGDVFVKDLHRRIYDLEPGNELHFPLFGAARLKKRLSGFWDDPPTGFSAARRRPELSSAPDDAKDRDNASASSKVGADEEGDDPDNKSSQKSDDTTDLTTKDPVASEEEGAETEN